MSSSTTNQNAAATTVGPDASHTSATRNGPRPVIDLRVDSRSRNSRQVSPASTDPTASKAEQRQSWVTRAIVRVFDVAAASATLVFAAPVLIAIALLVKLTSRGPVLYGSTRLASDKPTFVAWKFRSMHENADDRLAELLAVDRDARTEYDLHRKLADDPRLTKLGRILRVTSLDELPQLINIIKGEMSVVGPRPKLINEQEFYGDQLPLVLSAKPGLTGLWQISGRSKLTMDERVALDVQYVTERTFLGDLKICFVTATQLLRPRQHGAT